MQMMPGQAFDQVEDALAQYLQTQYRICYPPVFVGRGEMLRWREAIAQMPLIEVGSQLHTRQQAGVLENAPSVSQHKLVQELRGEIKSGAFSQTPRSSARCLTCRPTTGR